LEGSEVVWEVKIMKNIIAVSTKAFISVTLLGCYLSGFQFCWFPSAKKGIWSPCYLSLSGIPSSLYAQTGQNANTAETEQGTSQTPRKRSRPRANFVKVVNFYLKDERLVSGKLVSEDRNRITVEVVDESRLVVYTYGKREIDIRTLQTRNVPESKYYQELAEYFSGRSWDFRDDPDDFIQAIRCYERAKQLMAPTQAKDSKKIDEINQKIKELQRDRDVWVREVESRAKLKKLEFEAEIEKRLNELEGAVDAISRRVDQSIADMRELERAISGINEGASRQLEILEERIIANRRLFDDLVYPRYYYPRYYYPRYYYPQVTPDDER